MGYLPQAETDMRLIEVVRKTLMRRGTLVSSQGFVKTSTIAASGHKRNQVFEPTNGSKNNSKSFANSDTGSMAAVRLSGRDDRK